MLDVWLKLLKLDSIFIVINRALYRGEKKQGQRRQSVDDDDLKKCAVLPALIVDVLVTLVTGMSAILSLSQKVYQGLLAGGPDYG